tara:strand:+ start:405 stop:629 length:225 start_codon:yes stop_codon:yes gene_type:complete
MPIADRPLAKSHTATREVTMVWHLAGVLVLVLPLVDFLGKLFTTESAFELLNLEMCYFMMPFPPKYILVALVTA